MPTYKISKGEGLTAEVTKTDFETTFTMLEVKTHFERLDNAKKELEAKISLEESTRKNVIKNHPAVEKMTEDERKAAYIFVKSLAEVEGFGERLKNIKDAITEYEEELENIEGQIGLTIEDEIKKDE